MFNLHQIFTQGVKSQKKTFAMDYFLVQRIESNLLKENGCIY